MINASELILNADGSIYHLNLLPEDLASTVITVGDPDRVAKVSSVSLLRIPAIWEING